MEKESEPQYEVKKENNRQTYYIYIAGQSCAQESEPQYEVKTEFPWLNIVISQETPMAGQSCFLPQNLIKKGASSKGVCAPKMIPPDL